MENKHLLQKALILKAPFPVACTMRRVYEVRRADPHTRVFALIDQGEAVIRWLAVVALASYRHDGYFDQSVNHYLEKLFLKKMSTGDWVYLVRSIFKAYHRARHKFPIPALINNYINPRGKPTVLAKSIDHLVTIRNGVVHGGFKDDCDLKKSIEDIKECLLTIMGQLYDFLSGFHPVYVKVDEKIEDVIPMLGAHSDFFPFDNYLDQVSLEKGEHMLLLNTDTHQPLLSLTPFCVLTPDNHFGMLSSFKEDEKLPGGYKVNIRTFYPPGEDWLPVSTIERLPYFSEEIDSFKKSMNRLTRTITSKEIEQMAAVKHFPSMATDIVERRELLVGREKEQLMIREWVERLEDKTNEQPVLFVEADMGVGKTSLLVNIALDMHCILHLVASTENRNEPQKIFASLCEQIVDKYEIGELGNIKFMDPIEAASNFGKVLNIVSDKISHQSEQPLVIIIDNLDGFRDKGSVFFELFPIPLPPKTGLILSGRSVPRFHRLPFPGILNLEPLQPQAIEEIVRVLLAVESNEEIKDLSCSLYEVTQGNPLFLRMLLKDSQLLDQHRMISEPGDVFRLLVERFDGRLDEDDYESFLAFLSIVEESLPISIIAEILGIKKRKAHTFCRTLQSYLRFTSSKIEFFTPQIAEYMAGRGNFAGLDPDIMGDTIRKFISYLKSSKDEQMIRYRRAYMPDLAARLPMPEPKERLREWIHSDDFQAKIKNSFRDNLPHQDVRLYLDNGGDVKLVLHIFRALLESDIEELLIGTLLVLQSLPEIPLQGFEEQLNKLASHPSPWVRRTLFRLRRSVLNNISKSSTLPGFAVMNLVAHLSFISKLLAPGDKFGIIITESFAERLELARQARVEFLATTLDEVALFKENGCEYIPFLRLLNSKGMDAFVVPKSSAISNIKELKGASVGFESGSISSIWLHQVLEDHGVPLTAVAEKQFLSLEDCSRALNMGHLDAAVLWEPWVSASEGKIIFTSGDPNQVINDVLCVRSDIALERVNEAVELVNIWNHFAGRINDDDFKIINRYFDISPREIEAQFKKIQFLTWDMSRKLFVDDAEKVGGVSHIAKRLSKLEGFKMPIFDLETSRKLIKQIDKHL
jgi:hypothetical protein